jgi:hypothetical protein
MEAPGKVKENATMTTTITHNSGSRILLTLPIPSFKSLLRMNHAINQIANTDPSTAGTMVNSPDIEVVECRTLLVKNKSGFDPHAFVKLRNM